MARHSGKGKVSDATREAAAALARGTRRPGQTKAETRLIAQGIERGIELYKKEQKAKARERNRARREGARREPEPVAEAAPPAPPRRASIPWLLLALTWVGIGAYAAIVYA